MLRINGNLDPSDPREFRLVRVGDLRIDQGVQRALRDQQVRAIAEDFNWNLVEVPTVAPDLTVIEGQQRVSALQHLDEDRVIMVIVIASAVTPAQQAAIARGITKGRTATRGYQDWKMRVQIGYERELMTARVLSERGLRMAEPSEAKSSPSLLGCVVEVDKAAHHRTLEEGQSVLERTLDVILTTWTEPFHQQNRWNSRLVKAVAWLFMSNPGVPVDLDALSEVLARKNPDQWNAYAQGLHESGGMSYAELIGQYLTAEYNGCSGNRFARLYWSKIV